MQYRKVDIKRGIGLIASTLFGLFVCFSLPQEAIDDGHVSDALITVFSVFEIF